MRCDICRWDPDTCPNASHHDIARHFHHLLAVYIADLIRDNRHVNDATIACYRELGAHVLDQTTVTARPADCT